MGSTTRAASPRSTAIHRAIDENVAPEGVIDLTPLSGRLDLFHDAVHPTPEGATEIALRVADRLAETLGPAAAPARQVRGAPPPPPATSQSGSGSIPRPSASRL